MFKKIQYLSTKDKIDYIWTYYKIHILGSLLIIITFSSIINSTLINPPPKDFVAISFLGTYMQDEQLSSLNKIINNKFLPEGEKKLSTISYGFYKTDDINMEMALQTKFMALIASKSLDITIGVESELTQLIASDYFTHLDGLINDDVLSSNKTYVDSNKNIIGMYIESSKVLDEIGFDYKDKIISIAGNTEKLDAAKDVFEFLLEE